MGINKRNKRKQVILISSGLAERFEWKRKRREAAEMAEELPVLNPGEMITGGWCVEKKLGEGGFGAVYKMRNNQTGELAAMKVEGVSEPIQVLKMEVLVLTQLATRGKKHVCKIMGKGRNNKYNYVIMTLVGHSLQDLKRSRIEGHLSISSALRVGSQCLEALMDLHDIEYLHRDVKPGNFAVGREEVREHRNVVILDFGMAKKFTNDRGEYRTPRNAAGFRGTVRYAPISCHRFKEQGRKDDLEVWFYQQVELTTGRLPWREIQDINETGKWKEDCRRNGKLFEKCPPQYREMLAYIDSVHMVDKPEYPKIGFLLRQMMNERGIKDSDPYDWETPVPPPAAEGFRW